MYRKKYKLFLLLSLLVSVTFCYGQNSTTKGKEFWFGFMYQAWTPTLSVHISSSINTTGTISIPSISFSQSFTVCADSTTQMMIPTNLAMATSSEVIENKGVYIIASDSVNVVAANSTNNSSDATAILPLHSLGTDYMIMAYSDLGPFTNTDKSEFLIVAAYDSTVVNITPSDSTLGGSSPGLTFSLTLQEGEVYQVQTDYTGDLTGSIINASQPIAVYGGIMCAAIPLGYCCCNHLYEQMYPVPSWGKEFITLPLMTRDSGSTYRILASQDSTFFSINSGSPIYLDQGEYYEEIIDGAVAIVGTKPLAVAQYSNSYTFDSISNGDPFMILMRSNDQMIQGSIFNTFDIGNVVNHYLNIIIKTSDTGLVKLDGSKLSSALFDTVSATGYSFVMLNIGVGTHTLQSDSGFIAYVYGYGLADAYGYVVNGGMQETDTLACDYFIAASVSPACIGGMNGAIDLIPSCTSASIYTYSWSTGDTLSGISELSMGAYTYTVTDSAGCVVSDTIFVSEDTSFLADTIFSVSSCVAGSDGAADLTLSSGTAPYTYNWSSGDSSEDISGLPAGIYSVTVTDNYGCIFIDSVEIKEDSSFTATAQGTNTSCKGGSDGSVDLVLTGGTAPFVYNWSNGDTLEDITGLTAGSYVVTITDTNGCVANDTIVIGEPAASLVIDSIISNGATCYAANDGSAYITVSGGVPPYTYLWSNGDSTEDIGGLSADVYFVFVDDSNGCQVIEFITIVEPAILTTLLMGTDVTCYGDSDGVANLTVTGGSAPYLYNWSTGDSTLEATNLKQGNYAATITDTQGCTAYDSITISEPIEVSNDISIQDPTCFDYCDGFAMVSATGGIAPYTFFWLDIVSDTISTDTIIQNQCGGQYFLHFMDANGCYMVSQLLLVTPPELNTVTSTYADTSNMGVGLCWVMVTGGTPPYQYQWDDLLMQTTDTAINLFAGIYNVVIADSNGCSDSGSVTVGNITGLAESGFVSDLQIFPNPSTGQFTLHLSFPKNTKASVKVFEFTGRMIYTHEITINGSHTEQINVKDYSAGVYFMQVSTTSGILTRKIVLY